MNNWLKYLVWSLLWCVVGLYLLSAAYMSHTHRSTQKVEDISIIISDSTASGNLVTVGMVNSWVKSSKIEVIGKSINDVDLDGLERHIDKHGIVNQVQCYTTYSGTLKIEISQFRPTMRILLNGYNAYITSDGYVFSAPSYASKYVPVVTGSYRPIFKPGFDGNAVEALKAKIDEYDVLIDKIEKEDKYPLYEEAKKNKEKLREVNRRYTQRMLFEDRDIFERRVDSLRHKNARERKLYTSIAHNLNVQIEKITNKQDLYRASQKKIQKRYEDFVKLITFVEQIEEDKFWSSEIVQIVADESVGGDLRLTLIPRSGDHSIVFGRIEDVEEKLDKLEIFYDTALKSKGWHKFKSISVEFKNQVVCK